MNPISDVVSAAKSSLDYKQLLKIFFLFVVISAIFEFAGWNGLLFSPIAFLKNRFGPKG